MKIALVSYECPPETGGGGIGTYVANAAQMLAGRGHHVEIFAGGEEPSVETATAGVQINRVGCSARGSFHQEVVSRFAERHDDIDFHVVEGPEYHADAQGVCEAFPELPMVVKLHTPQCLLQEVNLNRRLTKWDKARFLVGSIMSGELPSPYWTYDPSTDPERRHALEADVVVAPSRGIRDLMVDWWGLDKSNVMQFPNPFEPTESFLSIDPNTDTQRVTFVGRLEIRKGVLDLMRAVPVVLDRYPQAEFRFIGRAVDDPKTGESLRTLMERTLEPYHESVEFTGPVSYEQIPRYLADTDICAFPSLWENFPNVCLEAMSAARGVIGSTAGGMSDMLDEGACGHLVEPEAPEDLADAIVDLLAQPEKRKRLGRAARERMKTEYGFDAIAPQQEACYERAIA